MTANGYGIKFTEASLDRIDFGATALATSIKNLSTFTLEGWIKPGSSAGEANAPFYLERQGSSYKYPRLAASAWNNTTKGVGRLKFELARVDGTVDNNYIYTLGDLWDDYWHHVAFTANIGDKVYIIYLDGAEVATGSIVDGGLDGALAALKVTNAAPQAVMIGAGYDGTTYRYWDGKVDCIRLWNNVRSQNAIQTEMLDHLATPGSETNLIEEYRLNEGTGTSTAGIKNGTYTATLKRNGSSSATLWNIDRPFMGDGDFDETPPSNFTVSAHTSIGENGFTLNWASTTDDVYVQYYEITVATDVLFENTVGIYAALDVGLVVTYAVTDLTPATVYYARVRALDAALNATSYATYNTNASITTTSSADVSAPIASVAAAATSISDTGFTANWAASASSDETGYKLDVATDEDFTDFLSSYRNLDVGLVLTYAIVSGVEPSTIYYYRVRAYDAAANESVESNSIKVITSDPPDTTAPDVVVTSPATSIGSTSFTANWNVGVDNVGVDGYYLDVAVDDAFVSKVTGYDNLDVANVTSYGITGLTPSTGYYYRVRAYDAAANIGDNDDSGELATTTPSTVDEAGLLSITYDPTADTYVNETSPGTNYGTSTSLIVDNTASNVNRAYLKFDLTELTGTIVNANLNLYVSNISANTIKVRKVATGTWAEDVLTYTNDTLTFDTPEVTFVPSSLGLLAIDVASLLDDGFVEYSLVITSNGSDAFIFDSSEGTNMPYLEMEVDPTSTTEVQTFVASAENIDLTNLFKNPGAEIGGTAFGGSTGITKLGSSVLLQDNTYAFEGTYSCKVVTTALANDGVYFESATGLAIAGTGQTVKTAVAIRASASLTTIRLMLRIKYTDVTSSDSSLVTVYAHTEFQLWEVSGVATSGKTIDKIELHIYQTDAAIHTLWADSAIGVVTADTILPWDGDTSPDTDWDGTIDASSSTYSAVELLAVATYVGDGDEDNSVAVAYKRSTDDDWISLDALTGSINRGTKQVTATVGPIYKGNLLYNPSFTANATYWSASGAAGVTASRITTDGMEDESDADIACYEIVGDGTAVDQGFWIQSIRAVQGDVVTFSLYIKSVSGATTLRIIIDEKDSAEAWLVNGTEDIVVTTDWARYDFTRTVANASTQFVAPYIINTAATAATWRIDHAQLEINSVVTPYHDGDADDAEWTGAAYNSPSYRVIRHDATYDVRFTFTDPDGITGSNPVSTQVLTTASPTDPITLTTLVLTAAETSIAATMDFSGDDNLSATFLVQWKRADLSTWSKVIHSVNRTTQQVTATISGLKPGTVYDVRVTATDLDDAVYGGTVVSTTVGYAQLQATTTLSDGISPTARTRITFGGFVLMGDEDGFVGVTEHDAFSLPNRRTQIEDLPRLHGAIEISNYWGKRVIRMRGVVYGNSRGELNDNVAALRRALAPRLQRLVVDTLDSQNYYFTASVTSLGITEIGGQTISHVMWDAEFTCADPFRYESAETVEAAVALNDAETVTITNSGDLSIDPVFTITTTSSSNITLTLTNTTTGERIKPVETITSGDKLIIDSSRLSLLKNGVEIDYSGAFPTLAVGANVIKLTLSAGSILLTTRRRHKFF